MAVVPLDPVAVSKQQYDLGGRINEGSVDHFSGDNFQHQPDDFVQQVKLKALAYFGSEPKKVTDDDDTLKPWKDWDNRNVGIFASCLKGSAYEWYKDWAIQPISSTNLEKNETLDFKDQIKEFLTEFSSTRNQLAAKCALKIMVMRPEESIRQFSTRVKKVSDIAWKDHGESNEVRDNKQQETFIKGLPEDLRKSCNKLLIRTPATTYKALYGHAEQHELVRASIGEDKFYKEETGNVLRDDINHVYQELDEMKLHMDKQQKEIDQNEVMMNNQNQNIANQAQTIAENQKLPGNNPRNKQNFTRHCTYCGEFGHTVLWCWRKQEQHGIPVGTITPKMRNEQFRDAFPSRGKGSRGKVPPPWQSPQTTPRPKNVFVGPNVPSPYQGGSPHARTEDQRAMYRNDNEWGYHYSPYYRQTGNVLHDTYAFRGRRDSGYGPPDRGQSWNTERIPATPYRPRIVKNESRQTPIAYNRQQYNAVPPYRQQPVNAQNFQPPGRNSSGPFQNPRFKQTAPQSQNIQQPQRGYRNTGIRARPQVRMVTINEDPEIRDFQVNAIHLN